MARFPAWSRSVFAVFAVLAALASGCAPSGAVVPGDRCAAMRARCGDDWAAWCESECVPSEARTTACDANEACLLCAEDASGPILFGLPSDLVYLWTSELGDEVADPTPITTPSGTVFDDGAAAWQAAATRTGSWQPYEPYAVAPGDPAGFCEPGPSQFLARNVSAPGGRLVMSAQRATDASFCDETECIAGPYPSCGVAPADACQYGEPPEPRGTGDGAQLDRGTLTYGFGRYRSIHAAGTESAPPSAGFDYAFFAQSNAYCLDGHENPASNTGEIDVEITSGTGSIWQGGPFCDERDMCVQLVNWVSSSQGVTDGVERRATSAFRFRSPDRAAQPHTWGWDWSPEAVRFTCDADPSDCDEHAGACERGRGSVVMCEHRRFVPQRPATLHLQLWSAWWAGGAPEGTHTEMRVDRVWHEPAPPP